MLSEEEKKKNKRIIAKRYYEAHKEEIAKKAKERNAAHSEEKKEYDKKYYIANKEKMDEQSKQYNATHKEEKSEYNKGYCKANVEKLQKHRKIYKLKSKYDITVEQYNFLLNKQNGCCNICKRYHTEFKQSLAVDHDHDTGIVRGLLCRQCNQALGTYNDSIDVLLNAIEHLKSNPLNL